MDNKRNRPYRMISCIIPFYNAERFLAESIQSVLNQSYPVHEIIVVDDGSIDNSAEVVRSFSSPRINFISQKNAGCVSARNAGIRIATGEFIALLDADDIWFPEKIATQMEMFCQDPKLAVCTTYMQNFWENQFAHEAEQNPHLRNPQPGMASTFMARTAAFNELGQFNEAMKHRDVQEFCIRAKLSGWQLCVLNEVLVDRRIHETNLSRNRNTGSSELLDLASQLLANKRAKS